MRVVLITGADRGIGRALCLSYHARGDRVIAACLDDSEILRAQGIWVESQIDVTSARAVRRLAQKLRGTTTTIDILINNAGVAGYDVFGELDYDDLCRQFNINALGPLRVTEAMLPQLTTGSKVVIVSSRLGSLADNATGGFYGYRLSKCAANMVGVNLHHDLGKRGIVTVMLHPGMVHTDQTFDDERGKGISPEEAAARLIACIDVAGLGTTLELLHVDGAPIPW